MIILPPELEISIPAILFSLLLKDTKHPVSPVFLTVIVNNLNDLFTGILLKIPQDVTCIILFG
jgi:hypothetical protein